MAFSENLKRLRKQNGIKQKELGEYIGYGCTAIANYESGRNKPDLDIALKIAQYFHVTLDELVREGESQPAPLLLLEEEEVKRTYETLREMFPQAQTQMLAAASLILSKKECH